VQAHAPSRHLQAYSVCVCVCVSAASKACQQPVKQKKEMSDLIAALGATSVFQVGSKLGTI